MGWEPQVHVVVLWRWFVATAEASIVCVASVEVEL